MQNNDCIHLDGLSAATYYKYFAQDNNPNIIRKIPLERVAAKGLYIKNKEVFDKFVEVY